MLTSIHSIDKLRSLIASMALATNGNKNEVRKAGIWLLKSFFGHFFLCYVTFVTYVRIRPDIGVLEKGARAYL